MSATSGPSTPEHHRLDATTSRAADWKHWGPYLSERAWGTVREDYSPGGTAWEYFPHDHARSRAYRWNEDGLLGICDRHQILCFAPVLWNGQDPILKERFFGVTGNQGNHGEDVKEEYFYLDNTPTHSYMKALYKYPQAAYPYDALVRETARRGRKDPEFELLDAGAFAENRYFDVFVEYAKAGEEDVLVRITAHNRGPEKAALHLLPTLWYRNTWSWGRDDTPRPCLNAAGSNHIVTDHAKQGRYVLYCDGEPQLLFCENETNFARLFGGQNASLCAKDGINDFVVHGHDDAVHPERLGTKAAAHYRFEIEAGKSAEVRLRLTREDFKRPFAQFEQLFDERKREADAFYAGFQPAALDSDEKDVQRQAFAGLLWTKQWYFYDVRDWLDGDPSQPPPPPGRKSGRNREWPHFDANSVLSMPDKWEYPWFAAWDTAFHCIPLALVDPAFAKRQLLLLLRDWYMHPNGQIPAYEWAFGDVNPPVHAWACWRVYKIEQKMTGRVDTDFLKRVFHKLLLNFTWWVNRKDADGKNVFQGGFLGMDNIGVFDRSQPLPTGGHLEQSDSTAWMGMYCLNLMAIALELARTDPAYEDVATKFYEHFMYIALAMHNMGEAGIELWSEKEGFFYDVLHLPDQKGGDAFVKLRVRSMVGLTPLFAVETIDPELLERLPRFRRRMDWFLRERPEMAKLVSRWQVEGSGHRHLLSLLRGHRMKCLLKRALDPAEFLSDYGVRSLSKFHEREPYIFDVNGTEYRVDYEPGESASGIFGGNSNWRGPIWMPVNYLLIESLQRFHHYYGDEFKVECPTGSGQYLTLWEIATELSRRLTALFLKGPGGERPAHRRRDLHQRDPHWRDHVLFYEYFHGDSGAGLGASHQTGWTALVAKLLQQCGEYRAGARPRATAETLMLSNKDLAEKK
ncbi:MAG: glucosidase [Planctomycetes bacterium]|nr:glucosidase [Planctomycetota bacterium]